MQGSKLWRGESLPDPHFLAVILFELPVSAVARNGFDKPPIKHFS